MKGNPQTTGGQTACLREDSELSMTCTFVVLSISNIVQKYFVMHRVVKQAGPAGHFGPTVHTFIIDRPMLT